MKRHDLDLFSLVSGVLFLTLGIVFGLRAVKVISLDLGAVPAVVFIAFGVAILASVAASVRSGRADRDESDTDPDSRSEPETEPATGTAAP